MIFYKYLFFFFMIILYHKKKLKIFINELCKRFHKRSKFLHFIEKMKKLLDFM